MCGRSSPRDPDRLAFVTQTTLSVDDTVDIVAALQGAFPGDHRPAQGRHLLRHDQPAGGGQGDRRPCDRHAGRRRAELVQLACAWSKWRERAGCACSQLVQRAAESTGQFWTAPTVGITAGASAPEALIDEVIAAFGERFDISVGTG